MLRDPKFSGTLNAEGVLDLYRMAGYSEAVAQKAANARANERMKRNLDP